MDAQQFIDLRERIALCKDFTPDERDIILDALLLNDKAYAHEYPPKYPPGASPALTLVWSILDRLPPNAMSKAHRFMLAGIMLATISDLCEKAGARIETIQ